MIFGPPQEQKEETHDEHGSKYHTVHRAQHNTETQNAQHTVNTQSLLTQVRVMHMHEEKTYELFYEGDETAGKLAEAVPNAETDEDDGEEATPPHTVPGRSDGSEETESEDEGNSSQSVIQDSTLDTDAIDMSVINTEDTTGNDIPTNSLDNEGIRCMYTNADSLLGKRELLKLKIEVYRPDVIIITEILPKNLTRTELLIEQELRIDGYNMYLGKHMKRGVVIYVSADLPSNKEEELSEDEFEEQVWVTVHTDRSNPLLLGCIYVSPNSTDQNQENLLRCLNMACNKQYKDIIIAGDFNKPKINWTTWNASANKDVKFLEVLQDNFLTQAVDQPTRIREGQRPTLDDLILYSGTDLVEDVKYTDPIGKSDHICLHFEITINPRCKRDTPSTMKLNMNKADPELLKQEFMSITWGDNCLSTLELWDQFRAEYTRITEKCIPKSKVKPAKWRRPLWMNKEAERLTRKKYWAWNRYRRNGSRQNHSNYVNIRNRVKNMSTKLRRNMEKKIAIEAKQNPKSFWTYVRQQTRTSQAQTPLETPDGSLTNNDKEKAEIWSDIFSSVFTKEDLENIPIMLPRTYTQEISRVEVTEDEVKKELSRLKIDKSPGPDYIHPKILQATADTLARPITNIIQSSLDSSELPEDWKRANITPIFKKGKRSTALNYRPVSLTSIVCKLLERLIRKRLMKHLDDNNLLTDHQYGFRSRRSTTLQLLRVLDQWTTWLDEGNNYDVIYMDFAKAFDSVPHQRLLAKIEAYGIRGSLLKWIENFIKDRHQRVKVNGEVSQWKEVESGIPQGSVLGPIFFIIYINDLPDNLQNQARMYADDTKLYGIVNVEAQHKSLQDDLNTVTGWANLWQLQFNISKCKVMHYGTHNNQFTYNMEKCGETIRLDKTEEEKDLGTIFTPRMKFSEHIAKAVSKANQITGMVRRSFRFMD